MASEGSYSERRITGETYRREAVIERSAIDTGNRTVEVAFSSEIPVERWFGVEVLDHSPSAVRLERMNNCGAVLFHHNRDQHIGVVERAWIGGDRKGRAVVRFGNSALANEKFSDVEDAILSHLSVGYTIHQTRTENKGTRKTRSSVRQIGSRWSFRL